MGHLKTTRFGSSAVSVSIHTSIDVSQALLPDFLVTDWPLLISLGVLLRRVACMHQSAYIHTLVVNRGTRLPVRVRACLRGRALPMVVGSTVEVILPTSQKRVRGQRRATRASPSRLYNASRAVIVIVQALNEQQRTPKEVNRRHSEADLRLDNMHRGMCVFSDVLQFVIIEKCIITIAREGHGRMTRKKAT
jgi:hypothetical protein